MNYNIGDTYIHISSFNIMMNMYLLNQVFTDIMHLLSLKLHSPFNTELENIYFYLCYFTFMLNTQTPVLAIECI